MDEVVGIAILETVTTPQRLYCLYKAGSDEPCPTVIKVHQEGTPKTCEPCWTYRIDGDTLHMLPSLHIRYQWPEDNSWRTIFHNGYNWSVKFKLAEPGSGYRQLKVINGIPIEEYD